jgi:hypothetical protein
MLRSYKENNWGNQVSSVWEYVKKRCRWKGAKIQRRLQPGGRGIALVRSRYQKCVVID